MKHPILLLLVIFPYLLIATINLSGNSYFSSDKIFQLIGRQADTSYDSKDIEQLMSEIVDLYLSRGFLFITVQMQDISFADSVYTANISIDEGTMVRAEHFLLRGNKVTKDRILLRESRIQKDQIVTQQVIEQAERRINTKRYITSTNIAPVNPNTLLINVVEGGMTHVSAIMGYSSKQTVGKKLQGFITADFLNLMGTDRDFGIVWRNVHPKETALLKYHESGPVNLPLFADFTLSREQNVDIYVRAEIGVDIGVGFYSQNIGISLKTVDTYPKKESDVSAQSEKMIGVFFAGDYTDDTYNPTQGWELGFREYLVLVDHENTHFKRYRTETRVANYLPIGSSFALANAVTFSHLQNKYLTEYDILHLGGTFTLRGFFEDMYTGNSILYTNTEFRFLMSRYSRVFIFVDYGYAEDARPDVKSKFTDLVGMGVGLRVNTPIGLLRMDYGFRHAESSWSNPLDPLVHFGIETVF